ncbi:MAG: FHA domain-containing protein [Isosphaeraceae bacterium]
MSQPRRLLGTMKPIGGGDSIPLYKDEILVGRRPTCDVRLDFENVSGKHCLLRLIEGVWHVRDLGSTNGTQVNRQKIDHEHGLMPDDELGVASHLYTIDYDPVSHVLQSKEVLEQEMARVEEDRGSLMERAGIVKDPERRRLARKIAEKAEAANSAQGAEFREAPRAGGTRAKQVSDEDFFRMIEEDVDNRR